MLGLADMSKLNELIKKHNTNKSKVEKECGLANGVIGKWEKGIANPSIDAVITLAKYFNVSTDYLLGLTEE